jgi:glutathione S-transferase
MPSNLLFPALSTLIALIIYFTQGIMVGTARIKHKIEAPKTQGNDDFERIFRVHYNTLEQMPIFITCLWFFALLISSTVAGWLGLLWSAGRIGYMIGYYKAAKLRSYGGTISSLTMLVLLLGSLWAVVSRMIWM